MPDYDLAGLSTRSFEQLIQAIAAKVIAPGIIVFGDGPDGGREATFEKRVPFPSSEEQWDGYCLVQAKFRQRPRGDHRDTDWLLKHLREELEKFSDKDRKLRTPEYYLLATNITLSSVADTGGKDKVTKLFKE